MSNPERAPEETVCVSPGPGPGPGPAAALTPDRALEILEPREVPLGGLRAMGVRRTLPQRERSLIGAWCFLDHYGPDDVATTGGMDVAAHPHIGLQTVSWLFSGEIEHRDSAGFHAIVRPGELNLMTAGRGISHSERSTPATTTLHGAQLWIALPERRRGIAAGFEHYGPPELKGSGWRAQVFLGSLLGDRSPIRTHTPLLGAEIGLDPGAVLDLGLDTVFEHGVLVDLGTVAVESPGGTVAGAGRTVEKDRLAFLPAGIARLRLTAGAEGARLLLLGGEPLGERIVMWWNFIGRDHDEIAQARIDWQARLAAIGVPEPAERGVAGGPSRAPAPAARPGGDAPPPDPDRFDLPRDEPEPPLSAPALPVARLLPRKQ
ncbi:pirin family protein [Leucobacter triazinivorans]|uniref:Pirin family protein n=1 Tax=Leucobacter triazinivorans TaxID=1784719 RepID=A0A4P6KE27_9MICO|nr:pirin family protein [Leucobacter triazinivorans]QBE48158.1 pirin family protein [Leucobacter triazinivorans]